MSVSFHEFRELLLGILDDESGITIETYHLLVNMGDGKFDDDQNQELEMIFDLTDHSEGRVFLPKDWRDDAIAMSWTHVGE